MAAVRLILYSSVVFILIDLGLLALNSRVTIPHLAWRFLRRFHIRVSLVDYPGIGLHRRVHSKEALSVGQYFQPQITAAVFSNFSQHPIEHNYFDRLS